MDKNNTWMKPQDFAIEWGGRTLKITTGKLAQQANGSVLVQYGQTVVLVTATMTPEPKTDLDYFPLMVDYEERLYAAGIIKGSRFIKRETRPSTEAVLAARLVDRAIRPLFSDSVRNEVQVIVTVLAVDGENASDVPALIGAAAALAISDIPWQGPIASATVGRIGGELILNPTALERETSEMHVHVAGDGVKTIMLEMDGKEVPEADVFAAIEFGLKHTQPVLDLIKRVQESVGKTKYEYHVDLTAEEKQALEEMKELRAFVKAEVAKQVAGFFQPGKNVSKALRKSSMGELKAQIDEMLKAKQVGKALRKDALKAYKEYVEESIGELVLKTKKRVDGRDLTEIRPLDVDVSLLERTHGTGMFTRGETQVLTVATLAGPGAEQILEGIEENGTKRYMHHYNFPAFSVGEVKPLRGPSRRDLGHGALAEKALEPVLPSKEEFPYTIRLVSEVLGSNGSSSMASTCGSTLALLDAGVPIKAPVAGIAMGLISNAAGEWQVLTDLQDLEDSKGGMDFKIAGTAKGITAIQMDTKTAGISSEIVQKTLDQAKTGRIEILAKMATVLAQPRPELSKFAPRVETLHINPDKIRDVIGPGGKMINKIIDETGVEIDIEQDGTVFVSSANPEGMLKAKKWIDDLTREVKAGEIFTGKVTRLMDFGAFVEVLPGQEGLVHVSEISYTRVDQVADVLKVGDEVQVKVKEIDDMGRINLSMKALLEKPAGYQEQERPKKKFFKRH